MGEMSKVNLVTCLFFTLLKHLMMLFKYNFTGLHFYTLSETLIACRAMQLIYILMETVLNSDFNIVHTGSRHIRRSDTCWIEMTRSVNWVRKSATGS